MTVRELAKSFAKEMGGTYRENPLTSPQKHEEQLINNLEKGLESLVEDFNQGLIAIYAVLEEAKVASNATNVAIPSLEELQERLANLSDKPVTDEETVLQELLEISDEALSVMFVAAHHHLSKNDYIQAANAFQVLTLLLPQIGDFWIGLGSSLEMQQKREEALDAFRAATILEPWNPAGYARACILALEMNQKDVAREIIHTAREWVAKSGIKQPAFEEEISSLEAIL